jgi:hypothetical protein
MIHRDRLQGAADKQAEIEHTLDDYERELLQAMEEGQLAPTPGPIPDKTFLEEAARTTLAKSERLTIRLTKMDLQALKHCAAREGVPYHNSPHPLSGRLRGHRLPAPRGRGGGAQRAYRASQHLPGNARLQSWRSVLRLFP